MDPEREQQRDDGVMAASQEQEEAPASEAGEDDEEEEHKPPPCRADGTNVQLEAAPALQARHASGTTASARAVHGFRNVHKQKSAAPGGKAWYGQVMWRKLYLNTNCYHTPEEAARAVDRYLYKLRGPEACNFPVTPALAAELDALTVEQIQAQFKLQRTRTPTSKFKGVTFDQHEGAWKARVSAALDGGQAKQASLAMGSSASEEQAAERVSAAAYILGDRCMSKVALGRFSNLPPAEGRALAVEVLGQARVEQLEELLRGGQVGADLKRARKRRRARSDDESSGASDSDTDEEEKEHDNGGKRPSHRAPASAPPSLPAAPAAAGASLCASTRFAHMFWSADTEPGQARATGQVVDGRGRLLRTRWYGDEEDAARAVDRLIYKVKGPEACNFPVTPKLAAELDALTVDQVQDELSNRRADKGKSSRFKGVCRYLTQWQAAVSLRHDGVRSKQVHLGHCATEEQAVERVRAVAYILGDRCVTATPGQRFNGLTPKQGRALAVEVLGEPCVVRLEAILQGSAQADGSASKRAQGAATSGGLNSRSEGAWADRGSAEPLLLHAVGRGGAAGEGVEGGAACERQVEADGGLEQQLQCVDEARQDNRPASWDVHAFVARVTESITLPMVQHAWQEVLEGLRAQQLASGDACGPIDTSLGTLPHPAMRASLVGLSEAFQMPEAVAAAWLGAQAEAEVFAERLGDEGLLDTTSLHRLTFLLAYSTLWLWQADRLRQELSEPQRQAPQ